jgi:hypothetical protein
MTPPSLAPATHQTDSVLCCSIKPLTEKINRYREQLAEIRVSNVSLRWNLRVGRGGNKKPDISKVLQRQDF